ncbi:MAG: response regulator [Chitinophagaceae bacterium]|jgi:CheY-like chemotaxis protein|nr:response regulator [Chitinophagaceae bacterium]
MSKIILLIDDDIDDQEFFLEAIKEVDPNIVCHITGSCDEGLSLLNNWSLLPDYIFLDLNMPKVDGKKCLVELKKTARLKDIPVIIYSTSSLKKDIEETKAMGAVHFLTKPAAFRDLCYAIENVLSQKFSKSTAN